MTRELNSEESLSLKAGDDHYRAFVGPPARYDLIGASQFALLFMLGMREHHRLLDFGCGSLRLGRLAIPYLRADRYFGVEPEAWLVEEGFRRELGQDAATVKRPRFDYNRDCRVDVFGETFDFIIAQSVFSHTGEAMAREALRQMAPSLAPGGLIVANWMVGPEVHDYHPVTRDWVYPECVRFEESRIETLAREAGLAIRATPFPHPLLTWYVLARSPEDLPDPAALATLGAAPLSRPA